MTVQGTSFSASYGLAYQPNAKKPEISEDKIVQSSEHKLSQKAQNYLDKLRKQFGDHDFIVADNGDDKRGLVKQSTKEFTVVYTSEEVERMASDEKYANEQLQRTATTWHMNDRICEEFGFTRAFGQADAEGVSYKPNTSLVEQLKSDQAAIQQRFLSTVQGMLAKQGKQVAIGEGIWKILAKGDYQVDAETQAAAKEAISDDGYWGVSKTSERILTYAKALAGDDPAKSESMRAAFVQGYEAATKAWGQSLPDITQKTYDATMKLFDEWANVKNEESADE